MDDQERNKVLLKARRLLVTAAHLLRDRDDHANVDAGCVEHAVEDTDRALTLLKQVAADDIASITDIRGTDRE